MRYGCQRPGQRHVEAIVGLRVVAIDELPDARGYTPALRRIALLADGSTVFVKAAVDEMTAGWLDAERRTYDALGGAPFLPRYHGCRDGVLVIEDLRHGHWPPPWRSDDIGRVFGMLDEVAATEPPAGVYDLVQVGDRMLRKWSTVAAHPAPVLGCGVCSSRWLDQALPALLEAEFSASLEGDALVHFDARSDNLCLLDDRTVLVDWNGTAKGTATLDRICLAQSVTVDGGPPPDSMVPDADPGIVAMITGYFAEQAPQPTIPSAPGVRRIQLAALRVCLPWAARLLALPPPR
jgi:hypothetical protein